MIIKRIAYSLFLLANITLAQALDETIITWEKPYGCAVTIKGTPFYVSTTQQDLPAFPVEVHFPADENIRQTRIKSMVSGEYSAYVTFKRMGFSEKRLHRFHLVAEQVNQPMLSLPAWCDVGEKIQSVTDKTKHIGEQVGEKAKHLGEHVGEKAKQAGHKAKDLFNQLKKELKP